jgi:hypothetical protein
MGKSFLETKVIPHLLHSTSVTLRPLYAILPLGTTSVPPHRTQVSGFSAIVPRYMGAIITQLPKIILVGYLGNSVKQLSHFS